MKSLKQKLMFYFIIIIITIVSLLEIFFMRMLRSHYYDNTESILVNQLRVSSELYSKYYSDISLTENVSSNVDAFWNRTDAQVQIYDFNGYLLMDSIAASENDTRESYPDIRLALTGQKGRWIGKVSDENVMAVSYPLMSKDKVIGVLRYITSLKEVDRTLRSIGILFIIIGLIVILLGAIISYFIAGGIVNPINSLTTIAEEYAQGNFEARNHDKSNDELGKLSRTFNFMADEIIKRDKLKNEFISSVSHELRTPLTAIKGWIITLNSSETDEQTLEMGFDIIEKETDRLTNMVEELLDFSRLTSGNMKLNMTKVSISDIVNYIRVYMSPRAKRENIEFNVYCEPGLPEVIVDSNRVKQVLINLVDNAIKFNESNGYVILNVVKKNDYIVMIVEDNGAGISEEELPHVKEKFYKGKSSKSQNGIGLSICDEIIKLHGGIFNIESEVGKGTKVTVKIPIGDEEA